MTKCRKFSCKQKNKCCCNQTQVVLYQRAAAIPNQPLFPPNASAAVEIINRSCESGLNLCRSSKCRCIVEELVRVQNELQSAFRQLRRDLVADFFVPNLVYRNNGVLYLNVSDYLTNVVDPLFAGARSVNPDYSTLTYQVHDEYVVTQYGTYTTTTISTGGVASVVVKEVIFTWHFICDTWFIVNATSTNLLVAI